MIFRFLRKLGSSPPAAEESPAGEPLEYKGYTIEPRPAKEAGGWRVAARISKEIQGERLTHTLIRADTFADRDFAVDMSVTKAKRAIDEQGEALLHKPQAQ